MGGWERIEDLKQVKEYWPMTLAMVFSTIATAPKWDSTPFWIVGMLCMWGAFMILALVKGKKRAEAEHRAKSLGEDMRRWEAEKTLLAKRLAHANATLSELRAILPERMGRMNNALALTRADAANVIAQETGAMISRDLKAFADVLTQLSMDIQADLRAPVAAKGWTCEQLTAVKRLAHKMTEDEAYKVDTGDLASLGDPEAFIQTLKGRA